MRTILVALVAVLSAGAAIAQGHPRILFRGKPPEFPWRDRLDDLRETPPGLALHWIYTGEEESARAARDALRGMSGDEGYGSTAAGPLLYLPVTYDWLHSWRGWTAADRRAVEEKIERTARSCRDFLAGSDDHVFHTSAPRAAMGLALAAIALEGHHPKAAEWLAFARDYLEKTYLPALAHLDGAAVAGMSYGVHEGFFPLGILLWSLESAKGSDYFAKEKRLGRLVEYLVQSVLPDQTFVRWGDIVGGGRASTRDEVRPVVDMFASGCGSADGFALSARIGRHGPNRGYHAQVLWLAPFFARETRDEAIRLPTAAIFGRDSVGHAFLRTGWGEEDTVVFFKCGDYFDDHGHFDQGSFTIYRREHLAVRSCAYGDFNAAHRMDFGRHSIAHSTLLIGKEEGRAGLQRIVRAMGAQDLADYLRQKKSKELETGDIAAWEAKPGYAYLAADLTAAYDRALVQRATRELVWLDGGWLVVLDRVSAGAPARWLLHTASTPRIEGNTAVIQGQESVLVSTTLLPESPRLVAVDGWRCAGKEYPPDAPGEFHVPGGHRLEVSGGAVFLHVLTATDRGKTPPRPRLAPGPEPALEVAGSRVSFPRFGAVKVQGAR